MTDSLSATVLIAIVLILVYRYVDRKKKPPEMTDKDVIENVERLRKLAIPLAIRAKLIVQACFELGSLYEPLWNGITKPDVAPSAPVIAFIDIDDKDQVTISWRRIRQPGDMYYVIMKDRTGNGFTINKCIHEKKGHTSALCWEEINGNVNVIFFVGPDRLTILDPLLCIPGMIEPFRAAMKQFTEQTGYENKIKTLKKNWDL